MRPPLTSLSEIQRGPRLTSVPISAVLLGVGAALIVLAVIVAAAVRSHEAMAALEAATAAEAASPHHSPSAPAPVVVPVQDRAPAEEIESAKTSGPAGLEALAQRFPKDPAVLKALMGAQVAQSSGYLPALTTARRLLKIAPASSDDDDLRKLVMTAAGGPALAAREAFDIMAKEMGSDGLDLLYEVAQKSPSLKEKALRMLGEAGTLERATPALRVAYELRVAASCNARKALLDRAAETGDRRAVDVLAPLIVAKPRGCGVFGLGGCPAPCGTIATEIKKAIAAIEARTSK